LVDDEVDAREALARYLRRAGHAVRCAGSGRQAIGILFHHTPDVVILDARMPEMDGVSFLETVRSYLRWQNLPVVLFTAYPEGLHIRRALELGVRKTLLKTNCDMQELLAHVEACAGVMTQPLPSNHQGAFDSGAPAVRN
jgi:CheY-like chemotaxis protein